MAQTLTDGNASWVGGMDTSRSPDELSPVHYSKGCNVIIPDNLGGISARFGFRCCYLEFRSKEEEALYSTGRVQTADYFKSGNQYYLVAVVNGIVFRFKKIGYSAFYCEGININSPNFLGYPQSWIIPVPSGCVINNGFNTPIYVTATSARRTRPDQGEIGIGQMGVFCQHRLFYVDQSGKNLIPSDFNQPVKLTEGPIFGNYSFQAPDSDEQIRAVARQKTQLNYIEGGNIVFSTDKDLYSIDVRGVRSSWNDLGVPLGKVGETIPDFSAVSSYSFESFNSNIYFRSVRYGIADLRQSEFQFSNLDSLSNQSLEANYYLNNDTDWMLPFCYTKGWNTRLLTTVAPQITKEGGVYWNGILSFSPSAIVQEGKRAPQRYESVFTGVRPWAMTVVKQDNSRDLLYVHSYDNDGVNRLYMMDENINHDLNHYGQRVEIRGFIETRGYNFEDRLNKKKINKRTLKTLPIESTFSLDVFARPEANGAWVNFYDVTHRICRAIVNNDVFDPQNTHAIGKRFVMSDEQMDQCQTDPSNNFIQYRIEFVGPIKFGWFVVEGMLEPSDETVTQSNAVCEPLIYDYRPDYNYLISDSSANLQYNYSAP